MSETISFFLLLEDFFTPEKKNISTAAAVRKARERSEIKTSLEKF